MLSKPGSRGMGNRKTIGAVLLAWANDALNCETATRRLAEVLLGKARSREPIRISILFIC